MKKYWLAGSLVALVLAGGATYAYFRHQVKLATNYDYKIKNFRYLGIEGDDIKVSSVIVITNRSNFKLTINSFDLELYYEGKKFSDVVSTTEIEILPNSSFEITGVGVINVNDLKEGLPIFIANTLKRKPVNIAVNGTVRINFMGINSSIVFDKQQFTYSSDILAEYGLADQYEKLKQKAPKLFNLLGIK
jgi:LEA14-like dessication related protein